MRSVAEVLSDDNRALLQVIRETRPESLAELAERTGRQPGNLCARSGKWRIAAWSKCGGSAGGRQAHATADRLPCQSTAKVV